MADGETIVYQNEYTKAWHHRPGCYGPTNKDPVPLGEVLFDPAADECGICLPDREREY